MDVVVHQHIGMQRDVGVEQGFAQQMQIAPPVGVIEEAGQAIVAALDDVLRYVGKIESGQACHAASFVGVRQPASAADADFRVGYLLDAASANPPKVNLTPFLPFLADSAAGRRHRGSRAGDCCRAGRCAAVCGEDRVGAGVPCGDFVGVRQPASAADADFQVGYLLGVPSANPPKVNLTPFLTPFLGGGLYCKGLRVGYGCSPTLTNL
jgi:hypothetical protein